MQTEFRKRGGECSQLLDLISMEGWLKSDGGGMSFRASEEKKLELTLAPPGGEGWPAVEDEPEKQTFNFSSSCFTKIPKSFDEHAFVGAEMGFADAAEPESEGFRKEQSHGSRMHTSSEKGALLRSSNQLRATSAPVVGWPPIRSFRKNIAMASTKQSNELSNGARENGETPKKGLFVKINMDGIPIGRKVDLNAHGSYQKLSSTVEELFSGLLAAQRDTAASGNGVSENDRMAFTGLLDGSGEYTLVYEDNEGDRMMVGDVPWDMFVSTAKRLRVLKNSELSALFMGAVNRKRAAES